jgi:hypothetical protein
MAFSRRLHSLWFDFVTLILEWINYAFFLMIVEGMAFTIRKKSHFRFCIAPNGSRIRSPECHAVYATIAFASIDLLLSFISGIAVTLAIHWQISLKYKDWRTLRRTKSPGDAPEVAV